MSLPTTPTAPAKRSLKPLQPAPWKPAPPPLPPLRNFYDLPAELRIQIYRLALQDVVIHIRSCGYSSDSHAEYLTESTTRSPHPLLLTTWQTRLEVFPLMHTICPIRTTVIDFDFSGLLTWLARIPPCEVDTCLAKNPNLLITLRTVQRARGDLPTLRRWLQVRADPCRPQPEWNYAGKEPPGKIASDLRRRAMRMPEPKKSGEFRHMLAKIGVRVPDPTASRRHASRSREEREEGISV